MRLLYGITDSMDMSLSKLQKLVMYRVYRDEGGCINRYFYIHVYSVHVRLKAGGGGDDRG